MAVFAGTVPAVLSADKGATALTAAPRVTPAAAFDPAMAQFMEKRSVPGGALAVVKDGRLVYAKGYGWADRDQQLPVKPNALFRIASISKPFTAVAVLKLVEAGKFTLEDRVFELLKLEPRVPPGRTLDERWRSITLRQLLQHTGGWDRDKSYDPMFRPRPIAEAVNESPPARPDAVIRYMLGQPLDFDPGTRYAYSNFGYCLLGRVIEKASGQPYEKFVRDNVLAPVGIRRMRLGASREDGRADGEVRYYTLKDDTAASVFPEVTDRVPWPYGGFHLEAMDSHGGWIASAVDLVRFATALDTGRPTALLKRAAMKEMIAAPAPPVSRNAEGDLADHWYGCGWLVRPVGSAGKCNTWHSGSLPGTYTLLVRRADGLTYAALYNQRSKDWANGDAEIDPILARASRKVTAWPTRDLFPKWSQV